MFKSIFIGICIATLAASCTSPVEPPGPSFKVRLDQNLQGDLELCDAGGNCRPLENPDDCSFLEVSIGEDVCATCGDTDGSIKYERCENGPVECVTITAPEPDCRVCAYLGGAVLFSDCDPGGPAICDGSTDAFGFPCRTCADENGRTILDECRSDCAGVMCPEIRCAAGYKPGSRPGECCDTCVPVDDCSGQVCPNDQPLPVCPDGSSLQRDPLFCCEYTCEPVSCPADRAGVACNSTSDCENGAICTRGVCVTESDSIDGSRTAGGSGDASTACPVGFEADHTPPNCGRCVPVGEPDLCATNNDCASGYSCFTDECFVSSECGCFEECSADQECVSYCVDCACRGACRPNDFVCPELELPPGCEKGDWVSPGRDANGCPLPPVCLCPDGDVSAVGECGNLCDDVACFASPQCEAGEILDTTYPYCCGRCVPDETCNGSDPCAVADCAAGYHCVAVDTCEAACVADPKTCTNSEQCGAEQRCSTERGECLPSPGCGADNTTCPSLCTGFCEDRGECAAGECGPALGLPNWTCDDGTIAGPTGRCLQSSLEECSWEVRSCP